MDHKKYQPITIPDLLKANKSMLDAHNGLKSAIAVATTGASIFRADKTLSGFLASSRKAYSVFNGDLLHSNFLSAQTNLSRLISQSKLNEKHINLFSPHKLLQHSEPWMKMAISSTNTATIIAKQMASRPEWFDQETNLSKILSAKSLAGSFFDPKNTAVSILNKTPNLFEASQQALMHIRPMGNSLTSIMRNHQKIYKAVDLFKTQINIPTISSSVLGWQTALSGISRTITSEVIKHRDTSMLKEFETVTAKVVSITESISAQKSITPDFNIAINEKLDAIRLEILEKIDFTSNTGARDAKIGLWVDILEIMLAILMYFMPLSDNGQNALTAVQIADVKKEVLTTVYKRLEKEIPSALINNKCILFFRPSSHSLKLMSLYPPLSITVIGKKGKWNQVTFLSKDGDPVTGWVLQKNLVNPRLKRKKIKANNAIHLSSADFRGGT